VQQWLLRHATSHGHRQKKPLQVQVQHHQQQSE
jgi:hypothetical protein